MASKAGKSGKAAKPPRSRPAAAAVLPAQQHAIVRFSPFSDHVAYLTQAIDRHRLQVYEVKAGSSSSASSSSAGSECRSRLVADYIIPNAHCESLAWASTATESSAAGSSTEDIDQAAETSISSKRRKKRQSLTNGGHEASNGDVQHQRQEVLALGLSTGDVHLYSSTHGKVLRVLDGKNASTSSAPSQSIVSLSLQGAILLACSVDGIITAWDLETASAKQSWQLSTKTEDGMPFQHVAALDNEHLVCAHHALRLVSKTTREAVAKYPGHASNVTHIVPIAGASLARFVSAARDDRILSIWQGPTDAEKAVPRPIATIALEAPARAVSSFEDAAGRAMLLIVTTQGRCSLYEVPHMLGADKSASKIRKSAGVQVLTKLADINVASSGVKSQDSSIPLLDAVAGKDNVVKTARLAKLQKLVFESTQLSQADGTYPEQINIARSGPPQQDQEAGDDNTLGGTARLQRQPAVADKTTHRRGAAGDLTGPNGMLPAPQDADGLGDDLADADVQGMEEPTLGQRLKGLHMANGPDKDGEVSDGDDDGAAPQKAALPTGSLSLGETLAQALHSNDTAMLSSCLAHSDPVVVRVSVTRLSGPLALRLLEHCVDRMGRGGKRSTGQLGSARTRGIIEWVRATLTAHTAYLMSLPHLVHRMAALHATLSTRLAAYERLLALNGRLELVLSQIELRAAYAAEQSAKVQGVKTKVGGGRTRNRASAKEAARKRQQQQGRTWVEESSDEDSDEAENGAMDVDASDSDEEQDADVVRGDEEGGVQDITLGNGTIANTSIDSDDAEEEDDDEAMDEDEESDESALDEEGDSDDIDEEDEEDDSEEDDDDYERGTGLIDDEAESTDDDGESDEEEEE